MQYLDDQWVSVSSDVVVVKASGMQFRTAHISGVRVWKRSAWWWLVYLAILTWCVALYYASFGLMCAMTDFGKQVLGISGLIFLGGIVLLLAARRLPPMQYHVTLNVQGHEHGIVYSPNETWAQTVADAIRQAVRGNVPEPSNIVPAGPT